MMRNSPPRNMSLSRHIYHSNAEVEKQWKDTLHQASFSLTSTLIQHYTRVIKNEQETLEKIKKEVTEYLQNFTGLCREDKIAKWKEQTRTAKEEARKLKLSESLKESREAKLSENGNERKVNKT